MSPKRTEIGHESTRKSTRRSGSQMSPAQSLVIMRLLTVGPDGFEPSPPVPKTGVLPLDDGP